MTKPEKSELKPKDLEKAVGGVKPAGTHPAGSHKPDKDRDESEDVRRTRERDAGGGIQPNR